MAALERANVTIGERYLRNVSILSWSQSKNKNHAERGGKHRNTFKESFGKPF